MGKPNDPEIIDRLGGTSAVARLCRVRPPSVSEWRRRGIPDARRQLLQLLHPEAFAALPAEPPPAPAGKEQGERSNHANAPCKAQPTGRGSPSVDKGER